MFDVVELVVRVRVRVGVRVRLRGTSMLLSWCSVSAGQRPVKSTFMYRLSSHTLVRGRGRGRGRGRVRGRGRGRVRARFRAR